MTARTVGLIGAGGIASAHLRAWLRLGAEVVLHSREGAPTLAAQYGGRVASSLDELLAVSDAVDVCTPTTSHPELVMAAAAAGKDIVCEKPLALTVPQVTAMLEACAAAGVQLFPAHVVRYFPAYATMHRAVEAGTLGPLAVQRFSRFGAAPRMPWFSDDTLSGGIVMDQMIHDLDVARWNAGEVASVYATRTAGDTDGGRSGPPVTAQVILTHTSGTVSHVHGLWGPATVEFQTRFEVVGEQGLVHHDSRDHPMVSFNGFPPEGGNGYRPTVPFTEDPYLTELRDFDRAFRAGTDPQVSALDGRAAVAIAAAANESVRSGDVVTMEALA